MKGIGCLQSLEKGFAGLFNRARGACVALVIVLVVFSGSMMAGPGTPVTTPNNSSQRSRSFGAGNGQANNSGGPDAALTPAASQGLSRGTLPPAKATFATIDHGTEQSGGGVYSTGTDDVIVRIIQSHYFGPHASGPAITNVITGFVDGIYLLSPGPERFLGLNTAGNQINLGKLPPGELIFAIRTPEKRTFQMGSASRNPDQLEHAIVKTYQSGEIEVWFEDLFGPRPGRSDRDFNDAAIQLRGGVANNGAVADLLKTIKEQNGETRTAAIAALKQLNPKAAAAAGFK